VLASAAAGAGLRSPFRAPEKQAPRRSRIASQAVIRLRYILLALAATCALAFPAPPAFAAQDGNWRHVIRECYNTGRLTPGKYTRQALRRARRRIPSDIKEYSDCLSEIEKALAAGARGDRRKPPPSPPPPAQPGTTPSGAVGDKQDLDALQRETDPKTRTKVPPEVTVGSDKLSPSTGGLLNAAQRTDANSLPLPLILALAGLAAMALLGGATVLRQRWPQARRAALRLIRR
jgi:hypothetical protein